jgi:L-iditol 2-dehydrogenase
MVEGGFAPKLLVPATNLHLLPDTLGFPEAALLEPLACVVRGLLERNQLFAGDKVVITGPGAIGLLALLVAKAAGAKVLMVGTQADQARLDLAQQLGADGILTTASANLGTVNALLGGLPEVVIECSGAAPAAQLLLSLVKKAGRYMQVGLYGQAVSLDFDQVCYKELHVSGSFATTPSSWYRALALASGVINLKDIVGRSYPLTEWEDAFAAVMNRTPGKVLLIP